MDLLLATHNQGKVRELTDLLANTDWQVRGLPEGTPEFPEDGDTFADNARGKALFYSAHCELPALADDSGLVVDALGGEPGVYSARYIDPDITQAARNAGLLSRLATTPDGQRQARFVCHLVLAVPGRVVHESVGACEGHITREPHGDGGFGYDPVFVPAGHERTFAELPRQDKSRLSHRGHAVRAMRDFLRSWNPDDVVS